MTVSYATNRVTVNGAHASGTTSSGSTSTTVEVTLGDVVTADIGRFIALVHDNTDTALTEVRQITGVSDSATTTVTVHDTWNTTPGSGVEWMVNHNCQDVHDLADASLEKIGERSYRWDGDWNINTDSFFGDVDVSLEMRQIATDSVGWKIEARGIVQFGVLWGGEANDAIETTNGCSITLKSERASTSILDSTDSREANGLVLNIYNTRWHSFTDENWQFIRGRGPIRMIGSIFDGVMAGRFTHEATEWADCRHSGVDNNIAAWSPAVTFTRDISNNIFAQNLVATKNRGTASGTYKNCRFLDSNTDIIRTDSGATGVQTYIDCEFDSDGTFFDTNKIDDVGDGTIRQAKTVNYTTIDSAGAAIQDVLVRINNRFDDTQGSATVSDASGVVAEIRTLNRDWVDSGSFNLYADFRIRIRKFGLRWLEITSSINDKINQSSVLSSDANVTQSSAASAAHTGITVTDSGVNPFTKDSKNYAIKIVGNLTTNPSLDIDDIKHFIHYSLSQNSAFGGKANGAEYHDLLPMSGTESAYGAYSYKLDYDNEALGPFTVGETLTFSGGATGTLETLDDNGTNGTMEVLITFGTIPADNESITGGTSSATADVNGTPEIMYKGVVVVDESDNYFAGFTRFQSDDGTYYTVPTTDDLTINSSESASQIIVFTTGTQTEIVTEASASQLIYTHSSQTVDITVMKQGFIPFRQTGVVLSGDVTIQADLVASREYDSSHGLTYTTDASWSRTNNELTIPAWGVTGRGVFSLMLDSFRTESSLRNTAFNLEMDGSNSLFLVDDAEGVNDASIANITRAGVGYYDTSDTLTASWASVLSVGAATGFTGEYQQVDGSGTADARASGIFDQAIKVYGDASHGNFDYRGHLVLKYQVNGYYQSRADVLAQFGISALEPALYIVAMDPQSTGIATGDPAISITITDHTASPITVGGKSFDYEIVDNGTNTAEDILKEINYNLSLDATYQGKDPFNYPDAVIESGGNYETQYGRVEGQDTTTTYHGFYVSRGAADHPGFTRYQSNDGTYYTPTSVVSWDWASGIDDTRVRLYNVTAATEIDNSVISGGGGYSYILTPGVEFTSGDQITMLATYQQAGVAKQVFRSSTVVTTANVTVSDSQVDWVEPNVLALDGSTFSEFTTDYVSVEVEVVDSDNTTQKSRIAAFIVDALQTADGIRNWVSLGGSPAITYQSAGKATVDTTVAAVTVINTKAASTLDVTDDFEFDWSDGTKRATAILGSSIIWLSPASVLPYASGSGVTSQDKTDIIDGVHSKVVEDGDTFIETTRLIRSATVQKSAVSGSTVTFRDAADSKDRITATVDSNGQRTAVTTDGT